MARDQLNHKLSLDVLALIKQMSDPGEPVPTAKIPADWRHNHCLGRLRLAPGQQWLDLRAFETRQALRIELAEIATRIGVMDIDVSSVRAAKRELTQAIARWAYERDYAGIVYSSRFHDLFDCWAIFEGSAFEPQGYPEPILPDDPDLLEIARLFGLEAS